MEKFYFDIQRFTITESEVTKITIDNTSEATAYDSADNELGKITITGSSLNVSSYTNLETLNVGSVELETLNVEYSRRRAFS